jgi:hypothetical protein
MTTNSGARENKGIFVIITNVTVLCLLQPNWHVEHISFSCMNQVILPSWDSK